MPPKQVKDELQNIFATYKRLFDNFWGSPFILPIFLLVVGSVGLYLGSQVVTSYWKVLFILCGMMGLAIGFILLLFDIEAFTEWPRPYLGGASMAVGVFVLALGIDKNALLVGSGLMMVFGALAFSGSTLSVKYRKRKK